MHRIIGKKKSIIGRYNLNENKWVPDLLIRQTNATHPEISMINISLLAKCQQATVEVDITRHVQRHYEQKDSKTSKSVDYL